MEKDIFLCNLDEKRSIEIVKKLQVDDRFKWCDECFKSFENLKNLMFRKYKIVVEEDNHQSCFAVVRGTTYTIIDEEDSERIRKLPLKHFDTNNLAW